MANILLPFGATSARYQVNKSLRLRAANSAYLSRTPSASTSVQWAFGVRVKRGTLGALQTLLCGWSNGSNFAALEFNASDQLDCYEYAVGYAARRLSNAMFRDPSAWLDIVVFYDSANGAAGNRIRIWVNGTEITSWSSSANPSSSLGSFINASGCTMYIGRRGDGYGSFDGHIAEARMVTGIGAVLPTMFGKADAQTDQWIPIGYTGSYNTNGFLLDFKDATSTATIGHDVSGNANHWTTSGIGVAAGVAFDQSNDTPTNNHATIFPIDGPLTNGARSFADAGLKIIGIASIANQAVGFASLSAPPDFGGFYFEATAQNLDVNTSSYVGIGGPARFYAPNGQYWDGSSWGAYGAAYATGDVIGVAANMAASELEFFKNGVGQGKKTGIPYSPVASYPYFSAHSSGAVPSWTLNFGQRPFSFTPPFGVKALNAKNLPAPSLKRASEGLSVLLDTGANIKGACEAAYPGAGFLALIKDLANPNNWQAIDTVRGTNAVLQTNTTAAETTYSAPSGNSVGYVWKRDAAYGFDIVTYTGTGAARTVAHALGAVPHLIIVKPRGGTVANGWRVYHRSLSSAASYLQLNTTAAQATYSDWNSTAPTASVFSVDGTPAQTTNENGTNYVAYLWTEIPGFSCIGAYTGNGSTDGTFVWCGFRPRVVLIKSNTSATSWMIYDGARNPFNIADLRLATNVTNAEASSGAVDFLANGFKLRANDANTNGGATGYVFAAFAETPFKYANAR